MSNHPRTEAVINSKNLFKPSDVDRINSDVLTLAMILEEELQAMTEQRDQLLVVKLLVDKKLDEASASQHGASGLCCQLRLQERARAILADKKAVIGRKALVEITMSDPGEDNLVQIAQEGIAEMDSIS